ncbi:hypothetical protein DSM25559_0722 [Agrobacterium rosae]|uniref:N-acetyltransferase domain-containing protein n=1 Tax=Agrobacterium rosae TaxID=1972867 RepID=A0A1R3TIX9_9HYPH|nr:hypothetical protein DSM25559_0722 [Agrobacterium rosae]
MQISTSETGSKGQYTATLDGHVGEMTYSRASPKLIIIDHTGVADELRGKGVGPGAGSSCRRGSSQRRLENRAAVPVFQGPGVKTCRMG